MTVFGAIIYAVIAAVAAGLAVAYWYERKLHREAYRANEGLAESIRRAESEISALRINLARLEGSGYAQECRAVQRSFLESIQQNGQGTVRIGRRQSRDD